MAASYDPTDPRHLTPQQRFDAITAAFATGAGRVLALRVAAMPEISRALEDSTQNQLDVSPQTRLHVPRG